MKKYEAIGVVETQYFTRAMAFLDEMLKVSDVEFLNNENYLGGRLVTLIVGGSVSSVNVAIDAVRQSAECHQDNPLKMALLIMNPHQEIMKYIIPNKISTKPVNSNQKIKNTKKTEGK